QIGLKGDIHIWESSGLHIMSFIRDAQKGGIAALTFSQDGNRLASIGMDDHQTLVIWDWRKGQKLATARNHGNKVFGIKFAPANSNQLITFGVKHVRFWTHTGGGLTWRQAKLGDKFRQDTVLSGGSITYDEADQWVLGTSSGSII
ncbi:unnamed protein product, partial [Meganyctiphanes norvegica]